MVWIRVWTMGVEVGRAQAWKRRWPSPVRSADTASGTRLSGRDLLLAGVWAGSSPPATLPFPRRAGAAASCGRTEQRAGWFVLFLIKFFFESQNTSGPDFTDVHSFDLSLTNQLSNFQNISSMNVWLDNSWSSEDESTFLHQRVNIYIFLHDFL